MLSTRFGYGRPAARAKAFARALFLGVNFVRELPFGAFHFQGSFLVPSIHQNSSNSQLRPPRHSDLS